MNRGVVSHRPRFGHILVVFGLFLSLITVTMQGVNAPQTIAFGTAEIASLSNQYRTNAGLPALTTNGALTSSAQSKADHMAANSYFAHDAPDGTSPWYFFDAAGYSYITAGENLALSNKSASSVVTGWYDSPGHRANLLSSAFTEVGYGIAFVPSFTYNGTTYPNIYLVAAHYGQPFTYTPAPAAAPTPPQTTTVQPATTETVTPAPEAAPEVVESNQEANEADHPPVAAVVDNDNGTSASGTLAVASKEQPKLPASLAYTGLGFGIFLVVVGSIFEIRRLMHHLPLIPHHR